MSRFSSAAEQILACPSRSSGQAWIAFHRCVEAYSRLSGERFSEVFERIGAPHGVRRQARVEVAALQAATRALMAEREALLQQRVVQIAARRSEKRAGRRAVRPSLSALEERHRQATARQPAVGCWGWRALREGELGPRLSLGVLGAPPVHGGVGGRVTIDCRGASPPEGIAGALAASLGGQAQALWVLITPAQLGPWAAWDGAATLQELRRRSWGQARVVVVCPHPLTPAQLATLRDLERGLHAHGWRLNLAADVA